MKTNIKKINAFFQLASYLLTKKPGDTKFNYALKKVVKQCQPVLEDYNSELEDIAINNASTDDKGNLVHTKNEVTGEIIGYSYTKEAAIKRKADGKVLFTIEKDYPVKPHFCKDLPDDLTDEQKEVLADFVVQPETESEPA